MEENQVSDNVVTNPSFEPESEKMLSQSQVNKIVQHEKAKVALATKRELMEQHQRELEQLQSISQQQTQRNQNVPREVDADAIYQQVQERINQ